MRIITAAKCETAPHSHKVPTNFIFPNIKHPNLHFLDNKCNCPCTLCMLLLCFPLNGIKSRNYSSFVQTQITKQ